MTERCGHWMPRAQEPCGLGAGHLGPHRTRASCEQRNEWQKEYDKTPTRAAAKYARNVAWRQTERGREWVAEWEANPRRQALKALTAKRHTESGKSALYTARYSRRKADERDSDRLEALLGGHQKCHDRATI